MGDLQIHKPEIVQQVSGGQQNPQEVLNSAIEKQRQTIIEGMRQNLINLGYSQEKIKTFKFEVVGNIGIIINSKGFLNSWYKYSNGKVEYYTNLPGIQKDRFLGFGEKKSGYKLENGKLSKGGQEIHQFLSNGKINPDFVKGIDDLDFYTEAQNTFGLMKAIYEGDKIEFDVPSFYLSIVRGVSRIKDVMYFYSKGYIPEKDFEKLLLRAMQELPNQCSDTRFNNLVLGKRNGENVTMEITKSELDEYLKPTKGAPLITQKMYDDCLRRIEARDKKLIGEKGVKEQGRTERKIEGARNGFVDRVKGVLGF